MASRALNRLPLVSSSRVADVLRSAVWLVPAVCVAGAIALAVVLIVVDAGLRPSGGLLLFPGPPAGARSFLSAIVQAMISFTAVVFSITIVVLQLSSSQYSPRVLRRFMRDRLIQSSLGIFVATFAYAMVVLRAVKGGPGDGPDPPMARYATVPAPAPGVLVSVSTRRLISLAAEHGCMLRLAVRIGDYLPEGAALFEVHGVPGRRAEDEPAQRRRWHAALYRHVAFDTERTMEQDAAFGFRQLVDIALQALSPAVNAPTTAAQAVDEMNDLLRRLVTRPQRGGCYRDDGGELRLVVPQYDVADYLQLAVEEIWHYGHGSPQIPGRLRRMLDDLHAVARPEHRPAIDAWRTRVREPDPAP